MKEVMIYSHEIAKLIRKENKTIRRNIRNLLIKFPNSIEWFECSCYKDIKGEWRPCYKCTLDGVKLIIDNFRKSPEMQPLIDWYNINSKTNIETMVLTSRFEDGFIEKLEQSLIPFNYKLQKQKSIFNGKYRIDAYIEDLKIAIEYDEEQHDFQKEEDELRQHKIEEELNCSFVRCNYKNTDAYNIGLVIKYIINNNHKKKGA